MIEAILRWHAEGVPARFRFEPFHVSEPPGYEPPDFQGTQ
jgi:hypothetical protein